MEANPLLLLTTSTSGSGGGTHCKGKVLTLMTEVINKSSSSSDLKEEEEETEEEEESGPSMKKKADIAIRKPVITLGQLDELQRQLVIYKYIVSGLPVPSALLVPIWNSVAASFGFVVGIGSLEFDCKNMMESEPVRCRRTDGKKWRCRKNVVPGQKYCERHMHRGRQLSRKPVESLQIMTTHITSPPPENLTATKSENSNINSSGLVSKANISINHSLNYKSSSIASSSSSSSSSMIPRGIAGRVNATANMFSGTVHTDSTVTTAIVGTKKSGHDVSHMTNCISDKNENSGNYVGLKNLMKSSSNNKDIRIAPSQGLDFSPQSVLQVPSSRNLPYFWRSHVELEPGRCRRTDGKKWRCRREVVPKGKYCKMHMHRGAKKRIEASKTPALPNTILPDKGKSTIGLNTNLSISLATNPQLTMNDDVRETTVSVSSDMTISDAIIPSGEDGEFSS